MSRTWLITGSSRGFGLELTRAVLESGDRVLATARRPEQLTELLANEVKPFGVKVIIIEPGAFRTDWQGSSMRLHDVGADYEPSVGEINRMRERTNGTQPGDPARAARAILEVVDNDDPPRRLLLGAAAVAQARDAGAARAAELEQWAELCA